MKKHLYFLALPLLLAGCISIPTGDGGKVKISKDGVEFKDEDGEKASYIMDTDDGGMTIETEDGSKTTIGANAEIPDGFPKDILLPKNGELFQSVELPMDSGISYSIGYKVVGIAKEDAEQYRLFLDENGYEIDEMTLGEFVHHYTGRKNNEIISYQLMSEEDEKEYLISVSYQRQDAE